MKHAVHVVGLHEIEECFGDFKFVDALRKEVVLELDEGEEEVHDAEAIRAERIDRLAELSFHLRM